MRVLLDIDRELFLLYVPNANTRQPSQSSAHISIFAMGGYHISLLDHCGKVVSRRRSEGCENQLLHCLIPYDML